MNPPSDDAPAASSDPCDPAAFDRYRLLSEYTRDLILVIDRGGVIQWASPSHVDVLGIAPEEILGHHVGEFLHPEDREKQRRVMEERILDREWKRSELRVRHRDGTFLEVESVGVPVLDSAGAVERVVISARDIHARKDAERRLASSERLLRLILNQLPANVWTTDVNLVVTTSVGGGLSLIGLEPDQLVGLPLETVMEGDPLAGEAIALHKAALRGQTFATESAWRDRIYFMHVGPLLDDTGAIAGVLGTTVDITEQRQAERRFRSLFERNLAGVFRSTLSGGLIECNEAFARTFGYSSPAEMKGFRTTELYFHDEERAKLLAVLQTGREFVNLELRLRRKDGSAVWTLVNASIGPGLPGEGDVLEGTVIDISARKEAEAKIEYQAFHDPLTDLPNRFLFNDRLGLALAHAKRLSRRVAVLFLDLDHFKLVNDTLAHSAGDELLRQVARRLVASVRPDDTIARVGGDEFLFILPDVEQPDGAAKVAQNVLDALRLPFTIAGRELFVTASVGIAMSPQDGEDIETLVRHADGAMYRAKELGRNTFQFHTPVTQRRAEKRLTLETELRWAIERKEFFVVYQPIVNTLTGRVASIEALVRWRRPDGQVVTPSEFIPLAEDMGRIVSIGEYVMEKSCEDLRQLRSTIAPSLRLSVNLSARQVQDEGLVAGIERAVSQSGIDFRALDLEITESLFMRNREVAFKRLSSLRRCGVRISLDDFGTGYSSLSQLRALPIDRVKIDRSFVTDVARDRAGRKIVEAIISMTHSLDLTAVAEGVETSQQVSVLREAGCDELQGYVFTPPLELSALEVWLEAFGSSHAP